MRVAFLFLIAITSFGCQQATPYTPDRPNILLILTDDMGYGDVSNSGNPSIVTPQLDQLAAKSVRFQYFYVSPVCAPTRASLLTGKYHQRVGVRSVTNGFEFMDDDALTLAEVLQANNYRTAIFGKWHLGEYYPHLPNAQGFDEFLGFRTGHTADYFDALLEYNGEPKATKGYISDALTEAAIRFMTQDQQEPFFCYLAYNAPHTPLQIDSSAFQRHIKAGLDERTARIYGMIENLDANIGKLEKRLQEHHLYDNTIIIFLSDNGPISGWRLPQEQLRFNAGLRDQKFTIYEGGIRTQCYWKWGDRWPARYVQEHIGAHIDVMPTLLDLLGIIPTPSIDWDGHSLEKLLIGAPYIDTNRIFYQNFALETLRDPAPFPGGIARQNGWKMVNGEELYYLPDDAGETNNLANQYPQRLAELRGAYLQWWNSIQVEHPGGPFTVPVGYSQENPVLIKPHHGQAQEGVRFQGWKGLLGDRKGYHPTGVDGDWLSDWQAGASISWDIQVQTAGTYRISIPARGIIPAGQYQFQSTLNQKTLQQAMPALSDSLQWLPVQLGELELTPGTYQLQLQLEKKTSNDILEIEGIQLTSASFGN